MPHQTIQCPMLLITSSYQYANLHIHTFVAASGSPGRSHRILPSIVQVWFQSSFCLWGEKQCLRDSAPTCHWCLGYTTRRNTTVTLVCRPAPFYGLFIVALIWLPMPNLCRAAAPMLSCERHIGMQSQLSRENKTRAILGVYEEEHGCIVR